jgi:coenzyme F420-0:L-glutamate ligase/coenzyme F420-1:gamma-L-glutamate ligase
VISILPLRGVPEVTPGADLPGLLNDAAATEGGFKAGDVLVVTHKVISKAEGRLFPEEEKKTLVEGEARRILRRSGTLVIAETRHGFVCANAGVDTSNVPPGHVALLPEDPDASARRIRARLEHLTGLRLGVVVSDTFGRAWRLGQTDVAIGVAGFNPMTDHRGGSDTQGRALHATNICTADEIAGAAELVMGKAQGICAAVVRGVGVRKGRGAATMIARPPDQDLFR